MAATIELCGAVATIAGGRWTSDDAWLEQFLNGQVDDEPRATSDPQPDITEASRMAEMYCGRVLSETLEHQDLNPDMVY